MSAPLSPLETLLRGLPAGLVVLDRDGRVVLYNDAEAMLSGRRPGEVEGRDFFREVAPCADATLGEAFRTALAEGRPVDADTEFAFSFPGRTVDVRIRMRTIVLAGEPHVVLMIDDNTRLKEADRTMAAALSEARAQAIRDPLTELFNRRYVESILPGELARAQRYEVPLSLLVVDVDHFKRVNDRFGHPVGDRVLIRLAGVMGRMRRVSDTCARIGGEEFCVVLPHTATAQAAAAADRLHRVVRALRFEEEPDLRVTISIGVATTPAAIPRETAFDVQVKDLLGRADQALYEAKRSGRDRTVVSEPA